jgi:ABC-type nitrate/sulfonate/bicarbonate transport system permease component
MNWPLLLMGLAFLGAWEIAAHRAETTLILVPLGDIWNRGVEMWRHENLLLDIRTSALEFVLGFLIAAVAGIATGVAAGNWYYVGRVALPIVTAGYAVPIIALGPLFIIGLGIGIASKVAVVALACFFSIALNTTTGAKVTGREYRELGRAFNLSPWAVVHKIVLPNCIPYIVSGLRVATGRGITAVLAAELFGARAGLGWRILNASGTFDTAGVYVGVLIFAFAGVALAFLWDVVERKIAPWQPSPS